MDEIQKELIKAGRKDLAQKYYEKVAGNFKKVIQLSDGLKLVVEYKTKYNSPPGNYSKELSITPIDKNAHEIPKHEWMWQSFVDE